MHGVNAPLRNTFKNLDHVPPRCRYLAGYPEDVRARVQKEWSERLAMPDYDFCHFMSSEVRV